MTLEKIRYGHIAYMPAADSLNEQIAEGFERENKSPMLHRTHYFEGRYENIYIDREKISGLENVLNQAMEYASEITGYSSRELQCGFWFNAMEPGDVTIPHTHDDDDELLSGVYYISVPDTSAKLLLGVGENRETIEPEAGKMVFFSPQLIHEVTRNQGSQRRLSIGMNFGLKQNAVD